MSTHQIQKQHAGVGVLKSPEYSSTVVTLVDFMGSDLSVVNAARVSFAKQSVLAPGETMVSARDQKLIEYLAMHNHWSPFGHAFVSFRIKASIICARQLVKSSVGLCWNEISRRYVSYEPEVCMVESWRGAPINAKQGSDGEPQLEQQIAHQIYDRINTEAIAAYNELIAGGVAPEQARLVLPQGTMTEWIWSGSLAAFARVCKLRLAPDAQQETREVAAGIAREMERLFPVSFKALMTLWKV